MSIFKRLLGNHSVKNKNWGCHAADLNSACLNCAKSTAWQILLKNALTRYISSISPLTIIEMHDITHISFTDDRRLKQLLMCIWRNLSSNFLNYDNAEQQTRATQSPFMRLPIPRTEAFKKSAYYKGCSYWNILPFEVRTILDQRAFKKAITVIITQGHFRRWCCWKHLSGLVRCIFIWPVLEV